MFKDWRTTLAGIATLISAIVPVLGVPLATAHILTGVGAALTAFLAADSANTK